MYFPTLSTLKSYTGVDEVTIAKLDAWLGIRRKAVIDFLNPLQFSIDSGIDEEFCLYLFALTSQNDIGVLRVKYVIECPCCEHVSKTYYKQIDVPRIFECLNCESTGPIRDEYITVWFELVKEAQEQPIRGNMKLVESIISPGKQLASNFRELQNVLIPQ